MTTLIISPHCDDEFISCGNLMSTCADDCKVVVLVSHGGGSEELPHIQGNALATWREHESERFCASIGVEKPTFLRLGYPFEIEHSGIVRYSDWVKRNAINYNRIFVSHTQDRHSDHKLAGVVAIEALQEVGWEGELWFYVTSIEAASHMPTPDWVHELTHEEYSIKLGWVSFYPSQKHFLPKWLPNHSWFRHERFFREG